MNRKPGGEEWAIVLAAGDGTRLRELTTRGGRATPKQFCSIRGGRSLLGDALARAAAVVAWDRIVVVVAADHRSFWEEELAGIDPANVVVQPQNRGTGAGILLPLLSILERDPLARVIVLPSDHFAEEERVIAASLRVALEAIEHDPGRLVLLGITPDAPETGYGWILSRKLGGALEDVLFFAEKPDGPRARGLMAAGAVWNSFLFAARGSMLLELFERSLPSLLGRLMDVMRAPWSKRKLLVDAVYQFLEPSDFSRDVLQESPDRLGLYRVPGCGWTDLGTPERVAACVARIRNGERPKVEMPYRYARFDLSWALAGRGPSSRPDQQAFVQSA